MMDAYDKALPYRLVFGLCFFAAMAAWAYSREGWESKRLSEYAFLLAAMFASIAYAVAHDQLTATISSEYFLIAKGLQQDPRPYRLAVAILAVKGSYWVGLVLGTALLVANNPSPKFPQLPYTALARLAALPLAAAVVAASLGGPLFTVLDFGQWSTAFEIAGQEGAHRFLLVWGVHAGSYIGALVGGLAAVVLAFRRRRAGARTPAPLCHLA